MIPGPAMTFLETERLLFRSHEPQDEPVFIAMHTDSEVRRYVGGKPWPLEKAQFRFRNQFLGRPMDAYGLWATILKEEANYIGCCGLRPGEHQAEAQLSFYLARPYWRRGFASEASKAFIDLAFTRLRLDRLRAEVEKGNVPSEHILQKSGFKYISQEVIPANGRILYSYELTRIDWQKRGI
jgi:RimJ/RimL family protein N-acetyltransferase